MFQNLPGIIKIKIIPCSVLCLAIALLPGRRPGHEDAIVNPKSDTALRSQSYIEMGRVTSESMAVQLHRLAFFTVHM